MQAVGGGSCSRKPGAGCQLTALRFRQATSKAVLGDRDGPPVTIDVLEEHAAKWAREMMSKPPKDPEISTYVAAAMISGDLLVVVAVRGFPIAVHCGSLRFSG